MAVSVPGSKAHVTALTATWPPNRTVRSLVARRLMVEPRACRSALVADRDVHFFRLDLVHQLGHAPGKRRVGLDLEVVHALHRLMVFLAERHLPLGRFETHAFHRGDQ